MNKVILLASKKKLPFGVNLIEEPRTASADGTQTGSVVLLSRSNLFNLGTTYLVEYTLNIVAGTIRPRLGFAGGGIVRSTSGDYSEEVTCGGSNGFDFLGNSSFNGTISNVSVREIL